MKKLVIAVSATVALAVPAAVMADAPTNADEQNAAKECKALRTAMGELNFRATYGTNENGKNAFGKCVSRKANQEAKQREEAQESAAKQCKAEQADSNFAATHGGKTFEQFYGTNQNGKNAFGKCVSGKAKALKAAADSRDKARVNAAKTCRAEQKQLGDEAFEKKHGTNENKSNAFGKCVSKTVKANNSA